MTAQAVFVVHFPDPSTGRAKCGEEIDRAGAEPTVERWLCSGCLLMLKRDREMLGLDWLDKKQEESGEYVERSWPGETIMHAALGLAEEGTELLLAYRVGQMTRAVLKREHGTRGTRDEWTAEIRKESADLLLVLLDIARREDFSLARALIDRQAEIEARSLDHDPVGARP